MLSSVLEAGATAVNWTDHSPVLPELPSWQGKSDQDRLPSVKQSSGMAGAGVEGGDPLDRGSGTKYLSWELNDGEGGGQKLGGS